MYTKDLWFCEEYENLSQNSIVNYNIYFAFCIDPVGFPVYHSNGANMLYGDLSVINACL